MGTKITVEARRINIKEDQLVVPWESWCVLTPGVGKSKWRTAVSHQTLKVTLQVRLVEISVGSWLVAEVVSLIFLKLRGMSSVIFGLAALLVFLTSPVASISCYRYFSRIFNLKGDNSWKIHITRLQAGF